LADVAQKTEWELIKIRHLGRKTLQELKDILAVRGLSLDMRFDQTQLDALKEPQNDAS
jgi:DNA-directed RNA polymerase subunit alpha